MSLFSFLQSSSSARPAPAGKGLFGNINFGVPGGAPMGMFNNPAQQQQAAKLGQDRRGLFQSLFPDKKMGPPTPQNPAMLAAGIAQRPASALNEPAPFVGPVRPPPADTSTTPRPATMARPTQPALSAKDQKLSDKRLAKADKPPVQNTIQTRATMGPQLNVLQKMDSWEAKLREGGKGTVMGQTLFSRPIEKTREQLIKENPKSELARAYSTMGRPPPKPRNFMEWLNPSKTLQ